MAILSQARLWGPRMAIWEAYAVAKRIRSHEGNVVASAAWSFRPWFDIRLEVVNVFSPDNCLTKLLYLLYRFADEDDFPYLPRKLGSCDIGFNFKILG